LILISQGHFTFELTLAGLLEDILTRFQDERILLSLSDPAIGIRGDLFIADSTIFAARVEKPPIEGYAALRNLCQFAGAEFIMSKYERSEPDPAKRSICIDLAKLIKSVPSLPVDPSSLFSSEALMNKVSSNVVVGAPVVIAVPPMQLPTLPPPGTDFPQADQQSASSAKQRIDLAFEAAVQKRAAAKSKESPLALKRAATPAPAVPVDSPVVSPQPAPTMPQDFTAEPVSAPAQAMQPAPVPPPAPQFSLPSSQSAPPPAPQAVESPSPQSAPPAPTPVPGKNGTNRSQLSAEEIDWHTVREAAKRVEPVSKEPTVSFSLAEQIQQELAASDEEEEEVVVAEPIRRQALKKTFVGPLAAVRLFTAKLGRLVLPLAVIIVVLQGGKLWLESHGGAAGMKLPAFPAFDLLNGKQSKHAPPPAAHKDAPKPAHVNSRRDPASHPVVNRPSSTKSTTVHSPSIKAASSGKDSNKSANAKSGEKNASVGTERIVGTGSSKYPNSLIMREQIKPAPELPPRRHAYQTAPDISDDAK
jgi:hypothetical protein